MTSRLPIPGTMAPVSPIVARIAEAAKRNDALFVFGCSEGSGDRQDEDDEDDADEECGADCCEKTGCYAEDSGEQQDADDVGGHGFVT